MSSVVAAVGAPFDQGAVQGLRFQREIEQIGRDLRARYGRLGWREALWRAHRAPGRPLARFLPQIHERLRGIAAGAEVSVAMLELAADMQRVEGVGSVKGPTLEGCVELPPELESLLMSRRSVPDAVGFSSVELTCAPWAGCLAGVNDHGLAVLVVEDRGLAAPPLRAYAQDLVLRAQDLAAAVNHLRLRARYAGGTGALLVCDADGEARSLALRDGELLVSRAPHFGAPAEESTVRIDAGDRTLTWRDARGGEHSLRASPPEDD